MHRTSARASTRARGPRRVHRADTRIHLSAPRAHRPGLPRDLGDPLLNCWILAWDISRLPHALSGVWNAPNFFPYHDTLAYSEHLLGVAVLVAPVQWIGRNPVLTYNVAFIFSFVLAGSGMYLLAYGLTGNRVAAAVAGAAFAFCPYRADQVLAHPDAHVRMDADRVCGPFIDTPPADGGGTWPCFRGRVSAAGVVERLLAVLLLGRPGRRDRRRFRGRATCPLAANAPGPGRGRRCHWHAVMAPVALHYIAVKHAIGLVRSTREMESVQRASRRPTSRSIRRCVSGAECSRCRALSAVVCRCDHARAGRHRARHGRRPSSARGRPVAFGASRRSMPLAGVIALVLSLGPCAAHGGRASICGFLTASIAGCFTCYRASTDCACPRDSG